MGSKIIIKKKKESPLCSFVGFFEAGSWLDALAQGEQLTHSAKAPTAGCHRNNGKKIQNLPNGNCQLL